jgi:hypothetical protein
MTPFAFPEHGEFRIEVFQTGPSGEGDEVRVAAQAFFFTGQEPPIRPFGGKAIELRPEITAMGIACNDFSEGIYFNNGGTPQAQAAADSREYVDVGESATLTNAAPGGETITLEKFESATDPDNARDAAENVLHDILYQADPDDTEIQFSTQYRPAVAGSETYIALDLGYGEAAATAPPGNELADENGVGDPKIYMPSDFTIETPANYFDAAGVTFTRGVDFELKYTVDQPEGANHPQVIPFVGFIKDRQAHVYCTNPFPPADAAEATFIIPYEVFEIIDEAPPADDEDTYFEFGRFTHTAWEDQALADPGRLDLLGIDCHLSPTWQVVDAPPAQ